MADIQLTGFGEVAPREVDFTTHSSEIVSDIHWENWGAAELRGTGMQQNLAAHPDLANFQVPTEKVYIVAYLGQCEGKPAYTLSKRSFTSYSSAQAGGSATETNKLCGAG